MELVDDHKRKREEMEIQWKAPPTKKAKVSYHDKDHDDHDNNREVILSIENSQITTNKPVQEVKPLVIPLIHSENDSRHFAGNAVEAVSLDKLAEQEILAEVSGAANGVDQNLPHYHTNLVIQSIDHPSSSTTTATDNAVSKEGSNSNRKIPKGSLLMALMDRHKENHQQGSSAGGDGSGGGTEGAIKLNLAAHAPDLDVRSDIYETIPVEEFGAALLRGMGWSGDKKQQSAEEKKLEQRQRRLGLGAAALPGPPSSGNKAIGGDGNIKDKKEKKDEKTDKQSQLQKGSIVFVHPETTQQDGERGEERDEGSERERGEVVLSVGVPGLNMIRISLEKSGKIVDVGRRTVRLVPKDELLQQPFVYAKPLEEDVTVSVDIDEYDDPLQLKQFKQRQEQQDSAKMKDSSAKPKPSSQQQQQPTYWIRPGLRVKIVSRKLGKNSYLQKGTILDVYKLGVATVRLDGGTILDEVKEKYLETVMPSVGGQCMVLAGEFKGEIGRLLSRDNEQQVAMLELQDSLEVVAKSMDDISAFVNN